MIPINRVSGWCIVSRWGRPIMWGLTERQAKEWAVPARGESAVDSGHVTQPQAQ